MPERLQGRLFRQFDDLKHASSDGSTNWFDVGRQENLGD